MQTAEPPKSKPSARWGGTGMRARGVWLQTPMWELGSWGEVTGCRTPGDDASRRATNETTARWKMSVTGCYNQGFVPARQPFDLPLVR